MRTRPEVFFLIAMKAIVSGILQESPSAFELGRNTLHLTSTLCSSATKEEDF